jgi:hypothetical protein
MDQSVKLQTARLPRILGDLAHSNQVLKVFALFGMLLSLMTSGLLYVLATRPPLILTLDARGGALEKTELPKPQDQIRSAVARYIELRYRWEPANVKLKLQQSESFVLPGSLKAFRSAVANVAKFATEKLVSQRAYPDRMDVNLENRTVSITGDRITAIQGMKAAGNLRLELSFESGPRTADNPWGVYISKEREEN